MKFKYSALVKISNLTYNSIEDEEIREEIILWMETNVGNWNKD